MQERNRFIFQNRSRRPKLIGQRRIGGIEPPLLVPQTNVLPLDDIRHATETAFQMKEIQND